MFADGAMPIVPQTAGPEVGKNVAEEIGADDDVEAIRKADEMRAQDVDVELVGADRPDSARPSPEIARPRTAS